MPKILFDKEKIKNEENSCISSRSNDALRIVCFALCCGRQRELQNRVQVC
jgi:hypothetical protein